MARKNFRELEARMSPEARARARAKTSEMLKELALSELRQIKKLTQQELAKLMDVDQAAISKLERRADMHVSTLNGVVEALGGKLELRAEFPDGDAFAVVLGGKKKRVA
jgi:DNA-binding XRE family transcriptional regulator